MLELEWLEECFNGVAWHRWQDPSVIKNYLWRQGCHDMWILVMYRRAHQISTPIEDKGRQVSPFQRKSYEKERNLG